MDDLQPVEIEKEPIGRSRAGDFVFGAFVGIIAIISAIMLGELGAGPAITIISFFLLALCLRYFTLRHAPVVAIGVDVTEEELAILKRMRTLVGALPQPVMILDGESIVEMVNPACIKMFGEDLIDKHISSFIRSPKALDVLRNARRQNAFTEAEFTSTGATERTHLFYAAPLDQDRLHGDGRMIVMIRDRTKQKKLEQMRTDFVANASHELRTPLTSMGGFIETLQGHAKDDPIAQEKFLNIMARQTNRMLRLVEDLIGLS
ncbi:MAG: histidine kinase dimerization/phospho-acceptor domain-containing protein, partial [Pseudomonadota bacterium]